MEPEPLGPDIPPAESSDNSPPEQKNDWPIMILIGTMFLGVVLFMQVFNKPADVSNSDYQYNNNPYGNPYSQNPPPDPYSKLLLQELQETRPETINDLKNQPVKSRGEIYHQNITSVVLLAVQDSATPSESEINFMGSGVVLSSSRYGYCILTAEHLLKSPYYNPKKQLLAYFQGNSAPQKIKLVKQSEKYDAMLLEFSDPAFKAAQTAVVGQSSLLNAGSEVFGIGSCSIGTFLLSSGYACAKSRKMLFTESYKLPTVILLDMMIIPGFSGGPIYNQYGELIGMMIGQYTEGGSGVIGAGLPIDDLRKDFGNVF